MDGLRDKTQSATELIELELQCRFPLVPTRSLAWLVAFAVAVPGKGRLECAAAAMAAWQAEAGPEAEPEPEPAASRWASAANWKPHAQHLPARLRSPRRWAAAALQAQLRPAAAAG